MPTVSGEEALQHAKGLIIEPAYVIGGAPGSPSFTDLKKAGFTTIGLVAYPAWGDSEWAKVTQWVQAARLSGFITVIDFWGDYPTATAMTKASAATGVDAIALDEMLSTSHLTRPQLLSLIAAGLEANPNLKFLLNEYDPTSIKNAYDWTATYSTVQIATDDYYKMATISVGSQLAEKYGKRPAAWLLFSKASQNFDCYANLDVWAVYVKSLRIDTFFWDVDAAGTWQSNWHTASSF